MQFGQEIAYGPAVAGNQSLEAPFVAQYLSFEAGIAATRLSVDALVGTHHFCHITLLHQCLEGWQVGFPQVACRQLLHVEGVAVPFRSAMHGKVLRTSQQFLVFRRSQQTGLAVVVRLSLQSVDDGQSHPLRQVRVFAVGLLSASPAGVTVNVDVRRPERQTLIAFNFTLLLGLLGLSACLVADSGKYTVHQFVIPCRCHHGGDGKYGGKAVASYAVQCFVPPLELWNPQMLDGRRRVHHQLHLFVQFQSPYQVVGTLFSR